MISGFLHAGLLHIAFNMYFVYFLGNMLEPAIGKLRFGALYIVSLLGGSLGALLLSFNEARRSAHPAPRSGSWPARSSSCGRGASTRWSPAS